MRQKGWKIAGASVKGPLHEKKKQECQDYYYYKNNKNRLVACLADGAGSSEKSKIGAKIICETICDILIKKSAKDIINEIYNAIEVAREKLVFHKTNQDKCEKELENYAATIVGAYFNGKQGVVFQIGDGAIISEKQVLSRPQNGSFSNETFFYTMENWKDLLRVKNIKDCDNFILMSDGVTPFAIKPDNKHIQTGFTKPIINFLMNNNKDKSSKSLANTLNSKEARAANGDDKTLFWAKFLG